MLTTRRHFLKNLRDNLIEGIQSSLPAIALPQEEQKNLWINGGHISDLVPGNVKYINNDRHVIVSKDDGFFAIEAKDYTDNLTDRRLMLRVGFDGQVLINTQERCPDKTVFSLLLNDFINEEEDYQ